MERELAGLADGAGKNQERDEGRARADGEEAGRFETTLAAIVKKQRAGAAVEPEHAEEKSEVADARRDEGLLRRGGRARFVNPETDQQIRSEPDQFPADKKQEQAVGDDHAEHGGGKKREIREEAGEILVARHVAFAENENAKADERDHDEHGGGERIEDDADPHGLIAKAEPGEVLNGAVSRRRKVQANAADRDRQARRSGREQPTRTRDRRSRFREAQNQQRSRQRQVAGSTRNSRRSRKS